MFFIYKNGEFIGSPTGYIEDYNEFLKTKKNTNTLDKQRVLGRYFRKLTNNKKVIVIDTVYRKMAPSRKELFVVIQDPNYSEII